ncbi:MAG: Mur ligase family protein [Candidatus Dojkabacteria bacterium]
MYVLVIGLALLGFLLKLSERLKILQEKDYWLGRIVADKSIWRSETNELLLIFTLILEVREQVSTDSIENLPELQAFLLALFVSTQLLKLLQHKFKRPKATLRVFLIAIIAISVLFIPILLFPEIALVIILSATIFSLLDVIIANEFARHIVYIGHRREMSKASKLLYSIPNLTVVGITGSYGKSTTKEFAATILSNKFNVVYPPGSINTDIGIASYLSRTLEAMSESERNKIDIALIEMDAYVVGTLRRVTKYFPIDIAILTPINEQHLNTFGGKIENTLEGNYQMLQGFRSEDKMLIYNNKNSNSLKLANRFKKDYKLEPIAYGSGIVAKELSSWGEAKVKFSLTKPKISGEMPIPGSHNAENLHAAIVLAKKLGMTNDEIHSTFSELKLKSRTLNISLTPSGHELIDDSFNSNPDSVKANIKLLRERNRIVNALNIICFTGLYDLGPKSKQIHMELGDMLANHADLVIVTKNTFAKELNNKADIEVIPDASSQKNRIKNYLEQHKNRKVRIMIINRINSDLYNYIKAL